MLHFQILILLSDFHSKAMYKLGVQEEQQEGERLIEEQQIKGIFSILSQLRSFFCDCNLNNDID